MGGDAGRAPGPKARQQAAAEFRKVRRQAIDSVKEVARGAAQGAARGALTGAVDAAGHAEFPTLPWKRTMKPARARTPLSRERIVRVALQLIDAESTEAVTMRRVAIELDTGAASLYAYVQSREEILSLAHEAALDELTIDTAAEYDSWQEAVRAWGMELYRLYARHQDLARMSFADIPTGPRTMDIIEWLLTVCISKGLPPPIASWLLDRLVLYVAADAFEGWMLSRRFASSDPADTRTPQERGHEWFASVGEYFAALPADRYPSITGNVGALTGGDGSSRFEFGLDLLIAGAAALAAR